MRTRRGLWGLVPMVAWGSAASLAACVGDDPTIRSSPEPVDGGNGSDTSTGGDTGGPVQDSATADTSLPPVDAATICSPTAPQLFAPIAGLGTFCQGVANNHCALGEHCCKNQTLNTQACAVTTCGAGEIDLVCANSAECGAGQVCCGRGKVRTDVCTYLVVEDLTLSTCAASCVASDFQLCAGNAECGTKLCTPARVLTPDKKTTGLVQVSACR